MTGLPSYPQSGVIASQSTSSHSPTHGDGHAYVLGHTIDPLSGQAVRPTPFALEITKNVFSLVRELFSPR